ncbi:MAG: hypothetical protein LBR68_02275 [Lachnoclostridium sp.]|jgi:hypothetical protein|nr:hypothetical protein [Lachnoclostridium sp.]
MQENLKKPFYKKWWFIVICVLFAIGAVSAAIDNEDSSTPTDTAVTENEQLSEDEPETEQETEPEAEPEAETESSEVLDTETSEETSDEQIDDDTETDSSVPTRDNSSAKKKSLITGKHKVGKDITPGRYVVKGTGSGNFIVNDESGIPVYNEILGKTSGIELGVDNVTCDLVDGYEINISGLKKVSFVPAKTKRSKKLTTGTWVVGVDIKAGSYIATCEKGESGNFFVYDNDFPVVNEILDGSGSNLGVKKLKVDLEDEQIINISSLSSVTFK